MLGNFRGNAQTIADSICFVEYPGISYHYIDDVGVYAFDVVPDTVLLCSDSDTLLGGQFLNGRYKWNTGATDSIIRISDQGIYSVTVTLNNCVLADTVVVINNEEVIQASFALTDTFVCAGEVLPIAFGALGDYKWSNGQAGNSIQVAEPGRYEVTVSNACGDFYHHFNIEQKDCDCRLYIPNAIKPGSHGENAVFQIFISCDYPYELNSLRIYNRWGELVYATHEKSFESIQWDGTFRGRFLPTGTYVCHLNYSISKMGRKLHKSLVNSITLLK